MAEIETVPVPEGARCALHAELEAIALCTRCGSYACRDCTRGRGGRAYCAECVSLVPVLAEPGSRLFAAILDGLLIASPIWLAMLAGVVGRVGSERSDERLGVEFWAVAVLGIGGLLAVAGVNLVLAHKYGQTIAKRWLGLRVVRGDGTRADLVRIVLLRNVVPIAIGSVPFFGSLFQLADSLFIFRRDRRCIHDHIADTIVVKLPKSS